MPSFEQPPQAVKVQARETSGLFPLPVLAQSHTMNLTVWMVNPTGQGATARVVVLGLRDGVRNKLLDMVLDVPALGMACATLSGLAKANVSSVEIVASKSRPQLLSSSQLSVTTAAEGHQRHLQSITPADFQPFGPVDVKAKPQANQQSKASVKSSSKKSLVKPQLKNVTQSVSPIEQTVLYSSALVVPVVQKGSLPQIRLYAVGQAPGENKVIFVIYTKGATGRDEPILQRTLSVGEGCAAEVQVPVSHLSGHPIRLAASLQTPGIIPSAALVVTDVASGTLSVDAWLSSASFFRPS